VVDDDILQHVHVERDIEGACAHRSHLTKHDVFCDTMAVIPLSDGGSLHENLDRLLER